MDNMTWMNENLHRRLTCVFAGLCRSAVTVAEEAGGTSRVGDFDGAGLVFLPSARGSLVLGVWGLPVPPDASVKVTDLFWSPCAVDTGEAVSNGRKECHPVASYHNSTTTGEWRQGWDRGSSWGELCKTDMQSILWRLQRGGG